MSLEAGCGGQFPRAGRNSQKILPCQGLSAPQQEHPSPLQTTQMPAGPCLTRSSPPGCRCRGSARSGTEVGLGAFFEESSPGAWPCPPCPSQRLEHRQWVGDREGTSGNHRRPIWGSHGGPGGGRVSTPERIQPSMFSELPLYPHHAGTRGGWCAGLGTTDLLCTGVWGIRLWGSGADCLRTRILGVWTPLHPHAGGTVGVKNFLWNGCWVGSVLLMSCEWACEGVCTCMCVCVCVCPCGIFFSLWARVCI